MPLPIRLVVVSWPAMSSRMQLVTSSSSVSRVALLLGGDQAAEQVVLGMLAALLGHGREVGHELEAAPTAAPACRLGVHVGIDGVGQRL